MKSLVNKEDKIPKQGRTIIKCTGCGFKYYEGDTHKCEGFVDPKYVGVVNVDKKDREEKTGEVQETEEVQDIKEEKETKKNRKESFRIKWSDN